MAGKIWLFIIGILILESRMCWGLDDSEEANGRGVVQNLDISPCIYFKGSTTFRDIITWLDTLKLLAVNTIWLDSIFPMVDGAPISDFTNVNSALGSMADFERLVDSAHKLGIRVIVGLMLFHTHVSHPWFKKWRDNVSPYNDFYVKLAGKVEPADATPTDLALYNKGWSEERQTLFLVNNLDIPILDLSNPEVRRQLNKEILEFWLNKGVDGFVMQKIQLYISHSSWLPPSSKNITASNKPYLYEVRKFVDDWAIENNSTPKYLGAVTSQYVNPRSMDTDTGEHIFNFIYSIMDFSDLYDTEYMKNFYTPRLQSYTPAGIKNQLTWSYEIPSQWIYLQKFITRHLLAMLMPGKVRFQFTSAYGGGRIDKWDTAVARQVAYLKQLPVFKDGDWQFKTMNNGAVLVLRRELPDDPKVFLVVVNTGYGAETVNLSTVFSDLKEQLNFVLSSSMKDTLSVRQQGIVQRDSFTLSAATAMVLISLR